MYRIHRAVHWASLDAYIRSLGPAAWFRKGNATTASWPDLSGNARTMTFFNTPTIEADGAVTMNGTNQYGKTAAFTLNQPEWVLWVGKQVSWTSGDVILDGAGVAGGAMQQTTSTPRLSISAGSSVAEISTVALNTVAVLSAVFNGASSSLSRNLDAAATGNAGAGNMGGLTLGAIGGGAAAWSNISTSELIVFPFAPSAALQARIIAGLMARHGVA